MLSPSPFSPATRGLTLLTITLVSLVVTGFRLAAAQAVVTGCLIGLVCWTMVRGPRMCINMWYLYTRFRKLKAERLLLEKEITATLHSLTTGQTYLQSPPKRAPNRTPSGCLARPNDLMQNSPLA